MSQHTASEGTLPAGFMLEPPVLPVRFDATAASILQDTQDLIQNVDVAISNIIEDVRPETATFANTVLPLVLQENELLYRAQLVDFYASVSPFQEVRRAARDASSKLSASQRRIVANRETYLLVLAVSARVQNPDQESSRLVNKMLNERRREGLSVTQHNLGRLRRLDEELVHLKHDYLSVFDQSRSVVVVISKDDVYNVPQHVLDKLAPCSVLGGDFVELKMSTREQLYGLLSWVKSSSARERIYRDLTGQFGTNATRLEKAIALRFERARLLGFVNHAEYMMSNRMETSPQKIQNLLKGLVEELAPARNTIMKEWRALKQADAGNLAGPEDEKFHVWDRPYYSRVFHDRLTASDGNAVADRFDLFHSIRTMLDIFQDLFSLKFLHHACTSCQPKSTSDGHQQRWTWHEDVVMYAVWDAASQDAHEPKFLGFLYMDLYKREGKRPGFSDLPVVPGFVKADGTRSYPATALLCSYDKPRPGERCQLHHGEVVVLFHELGHGIHDVVAQTQYARFHGASTAADFNEAPSQMLEQWCWLPEVLDRLRATGDPEPTDFVPCPMSPVTPGQKASPGALSSSPRNVDLPSFVRIRQAKELVQQLALLSMSIFDLAIGQMQSAEEIKQLDVAKLADEVTCEVFGFDTADDMPPSPAIEPAYFTVDGMYIYLVSRLYSDDMFDTVFARDPMSSAAGLRYRKMVLENGSSVDEMTMLLSLLGHQPAAGLLGNSASRA